MFSPSPPREDGWIVMPGILNNGKEVDVFRSNVVAIGGGRTGYMTRVSYSKPPRILDSFANHRWRRYLLHLLSTYFTIAEISSEQMKMEQLNNNPVLNSYGRFVCREWNWWGNQAYEQRLREYKIIFMKETTYEDNQLTNPTPVLIWEHIC